MFSLALDRHALRLFTLFALVGVIAGIAYAAPAPKQKTSPPTRPSRKDAVDGQYFLRTIRPILIGRCLGCHGGEEPEAGLDVSLRAALVAGDARYVVPGNSAASVLMQRVAEGTMPPKGKLPADEIAALRRWIDAGAPWNGERLELHSITTSTRAGLDWWSLQPLRNVTPPRTEARPGAAPTAESRAVDAFVEARLRAAGLNFSPEASRATYIRRVTYDLHGLPPTLEEIRAFENDRRPDAYERLVDRLLASPRFGERFARRWLDAVRFAESDGYEHDLPRLKAWPYRDWVIAAFNDDMPYDRFVQEQLAGDALHPDDPRAVIPTGFLVAGGFDSVGANQAAETFRAEVRQDELEDMIGTTSQVLLGMTAQCARCHDHKFDPIPQTDYYRFQAALAGARHYPPGSKHEYYAVRSEAPPRVWLLKRGEVTARGAEMSPGALSAVRTLPATFSLPSSSTPANDDPARRLALARWITDPRNPLTARVMTNRVWSWLFGQGIVDTPNDFGFNGDRPSHPELLDWLASWFSRPAEADGQSERKPTGAAIAGRGAGWSVKRLVRALVLSRTYRQSSASNQAAEARDSGNRLLWRHNPRRLESEEVRDSILAVAGKLNLKMGGPGYQLFTWKDNAGALYQTIDPEGEEYCRRGIYRMVVRGAEDPLLASLDCPDSSITTPRRQATTTATQALSLLNNSFVERQSRAFAERLEREAATPDERIRRSYQLALGRDPAPGELDRARRFADRHGLAAWCRVLFNTSEFLYVE